MGIIQLESSGHGIAIDGRFKGNLREILDQSKLPLIMRYAQNPNPEMTGLDLSFGMHLARLLYVDHLQGREH
jgi:hypothetical protein